MEPASVAGLGTDLYGKNRCAEPGWGMDELSDPGSLNHLWLLAIGQDRSSLMFWHNGHVSLGVVLPGRGNSEF